VNRLALAAAMLVLAGCSSSGTSDYAQYYQALRQGVGASFGRARITKAQAAAIPYASMGYRLNDGAEQLVVLATDANGEQLWTSGAHIVIVTRGGRIVRTVGLPHDVAAVTPSAAQELPGILDARKGTLTYSRQEDFPDISTYGAAITCTAVPKGPQTIVILGRGISTVRIDEDCLNPSLGWSFTDSYWIDRQTGLAWRSIQHIHPKGGKIETEILRPPG
jgi:Group 4 capsule polysaccharide lipoprotein gfcB, YjbF